jgi:aldose 1-epimerase
MTLPRRCFAVCLVLALFAVFTSPLNAKSHITKHPYGKTPDGQSVDLFVLTNDKHMEVSITNYGGIIVSIRVPDRSGKIADVVLGYDSVEEYAAGNAHFGGTIGRYANRIAHGQFKLDGKTYTLPKNNGDNTLHGGLASFDKKFWEPRELTTSTDVSLELTYLSKDGEEGFPGNLSAKVVFTLPADRDELQIDYTATTNKDTVVNLTNHTYFNLAGEGNGDVLKDQLTLFASNYTPVDAGLIPTGEIRDVKNTPFDFLQPHAIGARINDRDEQLKLGSGYDHNWVIDHGPADLQIVRAAKVVDPSSGRVLEVLTSEPGVQLYTANHLNPADPGKHKHRYAPRTAFCLETQHFPDSPNQDNFPSSTLKPGEAFRSTTIFRFSTTDAPLSMY